MIDIRSRVLSWAVVLGWAVALCGVLLWPLTRGGYLLGHDLVFTPRQPLGLASIGVSSASPRAVPLDALVALAERVVDGASVGRVALIAPILAAGLGTAAVLRTQSLVARLAACGAAIWNPFLVERLALGQWALLWTYAALPWLVVAITRTRGRAGWLVRTAALFAASITPTGGLIAAVTAVSVAAATRRNVVATAGLALVVQLPWLLPALVSTAAATSDRAGVTAFSARAENSGGTLLSLVGGGGIWDSEVVPASRAGVLPWFWLAVLLAAGGYGLTRLVALVGRRLVITLAALAGAGLLLAVLTSVPGGAAIVRAAVAHLPGAGLLRDAQKWVLVLVLFESLLIGAAIDRVWERVRVVPWRGVLMVAGLALPVLVLPDAAATLRPTLEPVRYPRDWVAVARRIDGGDVAVLPWGSYRTFAWAPGRSVLDPAPRLLPQPTIVDDRLAISGRLLAGEDPRAATVGRALAGGPGLSGRLARQGVAWVVVEHGTPGALPDLTELRLVRPGATVSLYAVPESIIAHRVRTVRIVIVVAGDLIALLVLIWVTGWALLDRIVPKKLRPKTQEDADGPLLE